MSNKNFRYNNAVFHGYLQMGLTDYEYYLQLTNFNTLKL